MARMVYTICVPVVILSHSGTPRPPIEWVATRHAFLFAKSFPVLRVIWEIGMRFIGILSQ